MTPFAQVFDTGVVLADGEFSQLESAIIGAPLEMTNNYMRAVAYNEVRVQAASFILLMNVVVEWRGPCVGAFSALGCCGAFQRHVVCGVV